MHCMFGIGESLEVKLSKMVEKRQWGKLQDRYLDGSEKEQIALATACQKSKLDGSISIVLALLEQANERVKKSALASLRIIGNDHCTSTLQLIYQKTSESDTELREDIMNTIKVVRKRGSSYRIY